MPAAFSLLTTASLEYVDSVPSIIFDSDDLLAIDKPAGLIVHSDGRTEEPSVAEWVLEKYPALKDVGEPWTSPQGEVIPLPGIVHRLDRTTSGAMLIAKTSEMYRYLKEEFKARRIQKTYLAWAYGHPKEKEGTVVAEIVRTSEIPKRWAARPTTNDDKRAACLRRQAITKWKVLKQTDDASLLEIKPETGRTHQIRVHLASIGHPIVADHMYAADRASSEEALRLAGRTCLGFMRPALHASSITLEIKGKRQTFTAPLPNDFKHADEESL